MDSFNFIFIALEIAIFVLFFALGYCIARWVQPNPKNLIADKLGEITRELETHTEVARQLVARRLMEGKIPPDEARTQARLPPLPKAKPKSPAKPKAKAKNALS